MSVQGAKYGNVERLSKDIYEAVPIFVRAAKRHAILVNDPYFVLVPYDKDPATGIAIGVEVNSGNDHCVRQEEDQYVHVISYVIYIPLVGAGVIRASIDALAASIWLFYGFGRSFALNEGHGPSARLLPYLNVGVDVSQVYGEGG